MHILQYDVIYPENMPIEVPITEDINGLVFEEILKQIISDVEDCKDFSRAKACDLSVMYGIAKFKFLRVKNTSCPTTPDADIPDYKLWRIALNSPPNIIYVLLSELIEEDAYRLINSADTSKLNSSLSVALRQISQIITA